MPKRSAGIDDIPVHSGRESQRQKRSSSSSPPPPLAPSENGPVPSPPSPPILPPPTSDDWKLHHKLQEDVFARAEEQRRAINELEKRRREFIVLSEDIPAQAGAIQRRMEELHRRTVEVQAEYVEINAAYDREQVREEKWRSDFRAFVERFPPWLSTDIMPHYVSRHHFDLPETTLSQLGSTIEEVAASKLIGGGFAYEDLTTERASRIEEEIERLRKDAESVGHPGHMEKFDLVLLLDMDDPTSPLYRATMLVPTLIPLSPTEIDKVLTPAVNASTERWRKFRRLLITILNISVYSRVHFHVSAAKRNNELHLINVETVNLSAAIGADSMELAGQVERTRTALREMNQELEEQELSFQESVLDLIILSKGP